jgi:AcrR family transcriptional regulator
LFIRFEMSPTFTEAEREQIRQQLLRAGRELFAERGLKRTSLEDLTRPAGIAKSSFYAFFDSKEALYLELLMRERRRLAAEISAASIGSTGDARESLVRLMRVVVRELETNPLTRRIVTDPGEWRAVVRKVSPEQMEANVADSVRFVGDMIREGQESGKVAAGDPEVLAGVVRAVAVLTLHKEEIGREIYPEVLDTIIGFVADGMVDRRGRP